MSLLSKAVEQVDCSTELTSVTPEARPREHEKFSVQKDSPSKRIILIRNPLLLFVQKPGFPERQVRMDTGTPAGTFGPTRTRTRKNRTRVRVGSTTRTGYPRVLNAPADSQTCRVWYTRGISSINNILLSSTVWYNVDYSTISTLSFPELWAERACTFLGCMLLCHSHHDHFARTTCIS
jgi:hypothetical protein